eukprot:13010892-Alexandrium_andersonii.AAC.1
MAAKAGRTQPGPGVRFQKKGPSPACSQKGRDPPTRPSAHTSNAVIECAYVPIRCTCLSRMNDT